MRPATILLLPALLAVSLDCGHGKAHSPKWMQLAPSNSLMGLSSPFTRIFENSALQEALARYPLADQAVDLFLKHAHISPHQETGRVTLYVLEPPPGTPKDAIANPGNFLLLFSEFQDPKALQLAMVEAFPPEGSLQVAGRDCTLHVVLDVDRLHVRALCDREGRIWFGDLAALNTLAKGTPLPPRHPLNVSGAWISRNAPFQGFLQPKPILNELSGKLPQGLGWELPQGIEAMAWSLTPSAGKTSFLRLEIALAGSPEGIRQATPWLQRGVAVLGGLPGAPSTPPEILQEKNRVGLRCQVSRDQLQGVLSRLGQNGNWTFTIAPSGR